MNESGNYPQMTPMDADFFMAEKQIIRCFEAISSGCKTSTEVSAFTGLSIAASSAWLSELEAAGMIERTGWTQYLTSRGHPGRRSWLWRPVKK
jgi:predicted Rossmann fold nucleotide-binding protein DprA/Smf involved in DNA uptake